MTLGGFGARGYGRGRSRGRMYGLWEAPLHEHMILRTREVLGSMH